MLGASSVRCVGFSLAGDEENRRASHAEVTTFELNDSATGNPVPHGVHDLRLGTTDHGWLCLTCAQGKKLCPGHPGHMELRAAVFSPVAIAEVRRWLRVVCLQCGALVVEPERYAEARPGRRLQAAAAAAVDQAPCPRCRAPHPKILKDPEDHFSFLAAGGREGKRFVREPHIV